MKNIMLLFLVALTVTNSVYSQTDTKAKTILAGVSKKYRSYNMIKADFTFTLDNLQAKIKETQEGTLTVKTGANKYRVSMKDQEILSDGKSQWTYLKEDREVQVTDVDDGGDGLNPAKIFTIYESGFKSLYTGERKIGTKVYQTIDLSPIDTKKSYYKIRLTIDKVAKQISNALIFDRNGNRYTYAVRSFVPNVKVAENTFIFDANKYPGVEVVDLR